jgi:hypothetical protein
MVQEAHDVLVAALAGRRIDAPDVFPARFPLNRVPAVKIAISSALKREGITDLVCSAACGADLIALAAAEELNIRRRIVLPFDVQEFKNTSVVDRPGDWEGLYNRLTSTAGLTGDLTVLNGESDDEASYSRANYEIIRQAVSISPNALAIIVWEGGSRGKDDVTKEFRSLALKAKLRLLTVETC